MDLPKHTFHDVGAPLSLWFFREMLLHEVLNWPGKEGELDPKPGARAVPTLP